MPCEVMAICNIPFHWPSTIIQIFLNKAVPIIGSAKISAIDIGILAHIGNR